MFLLSLLPPPLPFLDFPPWILLADVEPQQKKQTYFRSELQALTRLPKTGSVLFSFKTYMYPISDIKEEGLGPELADAMEGLRKGNAPGMWRYKGAERWAEKLCSYLHSP